MPGADYFEIKRLNPDVNQRAVGFDCPGHRPVMPQFCCSGYFTVPFLEQHRALPDFS